MIKDTASRPSGRGNFKYRRELVLNSSNLEVPVQGQELQTLTTGLSMQGDYWDKCL